MSLIGRPPVIAGVDGSPRDVGVLRRAVLMAHQHAVPLRVLHVVGPDLAAGGEVLRAARRVVDDAGGLPEVEYDLRAGSAAVGLRCPSLNATLVVVGAPERTWPGREPSVAESLAASSPVPVLVVRGTAAPSGPVIAALDGSPSSPHVLAYAVEEADLAARPLVVVHVAGTPGAGLPHDLDALVQLWSAKFPEVALRTRVLSGDPARLLACEAAPAALIVLAARPPGHVAAGLLGPISRAVLYAAPCDVAVV